MFVVVLGMKILIRLLAEVKEKIEGRFRNRKLRMFESYKVKKSS